MTINYNSILLRKSMNGYIKSALTVKDVNINNTRQSRNKNGYLRYSNKKHKCIEAVPPRHLHIASVVSEPVVTVYPLDRRQFQNPMYPSSEASSVKESTPVQPTDETDSSCIATNSHSSLRSIFGTNTPTSNTSIASNTLISGSSGSYSSRAHVFLGREITSNTPVGTTRDSNAYCPKPPRYSDYISITNRKSSFQTLLWSVNSKPEVETLTENGFFFTGNADLVRCFQCGIGLKDWIKDDDVLAEHIRYSSDCGYLIQKFGKTEIDRLKAALTGQGGSSQNGQSGSSNSPLPYRIRSPRYQTMDARVASFQNFPTHLLLDHRGMAVAGLYFTGTGDLCRCFACDGGLKDWSTGDDAVKEHATYFPQCPYINQLKGPEYISHIQSTRQASNNPSDTTKNGTISQHSNSGSTSQTSSSGGDYHGATSQLFQSSFALSLDRLSIQTDPSSVMASQVFHQLGYSDLDVTNARSELASRGIFEPTSEDIVNAILDNQEKVTRHPEASATGNNSNDLKMIKEENERLLEMVQCMLCVTGEPDILFLPCAHHRVCRDCSESLTHCPVCQGYIKERVKTYRS